MASPRTIVVAGTGGQTASYELPPGVFQYVEAVYAEITNVGGSDAYPVLSVAEQSGQVIAKKQQGRTIPGGNPGSATWALRLDDETAPAKPLVSYEARVEVLQSVANRAALGGGAFDQVIFPGRENPVGVGEHRVTFSCLCYPRTNGTITLRASQLSGFDKEIVAGMTAMLVGRDLGFAPGTVNTTLASEASTSPVITTVPGNGVPTPIAFNSSQFDTAAMLNLVTHPTTFVCFTGGTYLVTVNAVWIP